MKEGLYLTLNQTNYQNILFRSRDAIVTMSKFVTKKEFVQISLYYISRLNQDIEELFSVLSLFEDRLSATDMKSLTIYILKFHFKSMTPFSRQNYKQQKI